MVSLRMIVGVLVAQWQTYLTAELLLASSISSRPITFTFGLIPSEKAWTTLSPSYGLNNTKTCGTLLEKQGLTRVKFFHGLLHVEVPVLADQQKLIYISSKRTQDEVWKTSRERWMIGTDRESQGNRCHLRDLMTMMTTVLLQGWLWHWIAHESWYTINQRNWTEGDQNNILCIDNNNM